MQGVLQGPQPPNPPCMPKEGFEPLPDPRQSLARTQLTTRVDPLRQSSCVPLVASERSSSVGMFHKACALKGET